MDLGTFLLLLPLGIQGAQAQEPPRPSPTPARSPTELERLFHDNCATCHGERGDGHGTARLDRQARSFEDGGFSYGNTPEALLRTITIGIPGTPMPGFDTSLSEEQRRALAAYVLSLGPEVVHVEPKDTVLVVHDRPLVVRGHLPPIVETAEERPRGLLVGLPDGLSFEYRTDDVRLLGVRQGGFVERTDWIGRGGTPLAPLGRLVHVLEGGRPRATFRLPRAGGSDGDAAPALAASFTGTRVQGSEVAVLYRLVADADDPARARALADVEETARGIGTSVGGGYLRSFRLRPAAGEPVDLFLTLTVLGEGDALVESFRTMGTTPSTEVGWVVVRRAAGGFEAIGVTLPTGSEPRRSHGAFEAPLRIVPGVEADVTVSTFLPTEWNDETGLRLANEVRR